MLLRFPGLDLLRTVQGPKDTLLDLGSGIGALTLGLLARTGAA